ncbi:MAG: SMI1/KNR4 family protein [Pseudomonadota bacterium]
MTEQSEANGMHYLEKIIAKLLALDDDGSKRLENGTLLIAEKKNRREGDLLFKHCINGALNDEQIARLEVEIQRKLPAALRDLYHYSNGGFLFSDSFSWNGLREDYSRSLGKWLPISLSYGNTQGRPLEGAVGQERFADNSNQVRFGWYSNADAEVYMLLDGDPKIYAAPRYKLEPVLYQWPDLETMFTTEVDRMIALYHARDGAVDSFNPLPAPWQQQ